MSGKDLKLLFLDIETAPHLATVWGLWQQNVGLNQIIEDGYTLCWAAKWKGKREVMFSSLYEDGEESMVNQIHELLDEADAVVTYNGNKFDLPTLNKEFLLNGLAPPAPYAKVDLLKTARGNFRFPSNKLDYVAKQLGLSGKMKHKGHELWLGCMNGDDKSWKIMERYNKKDVTLLEQVYNELLPWISPHPNMGLYVDNAKAPVCPKCGSHKLQRRGTTMTNTGKYWRYQCQSCGGWSRARFQDTTKQSTVLVQVR